MRRVVRGRCRSSRTRYLPWGSGLAAAVAVAVLLVFPMTGSPATGAKKACLPAPEKVTIGTFPYGTQLAVDLASNGLGYYAEVAKQFCTTITTQIFQAGQPLLTGLSTGQLQFSVYSEPNNLAAAAQHVTPLPEMIMGLSNGGGDFLVALKSNQATYGRGLPALVKYAQQSKPLAMPSLSAASILAESPLMDLAGVDWAKLNYVGLGVAGTTAAVLSGQVLLGQASVAAAPLIASGQLYNVLYTSGKTALKAYGGPFVQLGLNVLPSFTTQYPAFTQAMVTATIKAQQYIANHWKNPGPVYNNMPAAFKAVTPYANWPASWRYIAGLSYPMTGLFTQANVTLSVKIMKKYGQLDPNFVLPPNVVDPTFVRAAYKALKQKVPTTAVDTTRIARVPD